MARLWMSGFELNTVTANVEFTSTSGSPSISASNARTGTYCGAVTSLVSGTPQIFTYQFASANVSTDIKVRTYIYLTAYPNASTTIGAFFDSTGNNSSGMTMSTTGVITVKDNNGVTQATSFALSLNTWYRLEHRQFNSSTTLELLVNGVSQGSSTSAGTAVYYSYHWGGNINGSETATTIGIYFDDLAINDASGSSQTGYPGAGCCDIWRPNAAGASNTFATQTGGTAGASNNYTRVNEVTPDGATSFNGSNTLAQSDLYATTGTRLNTSTTVACVAVGVWYRASVASAESSFQIQCRTPANGMVTKSAAITPNSTTFKANANAAPFNYALVMYIDPNGSAWTISDINTTAGSGMQIGAIISTANTNRADISTVWAYIDYVPGPIGYDVFAGNNNLGASVGQSVMRASNF